MNGILPIIWPPHGNDVLPMPPVLNRLTFASTLSHLRRLNTPIGREGKLAKPRQLHNTHWGMVCPAEVRTTTAPIESEHGVCVSGHGRGRSVNAECESGLSRKLHDWHSPLKRPKQPQRFGSRRLMRRVTWHVGTSHLLAVNTSSAQMSHRSGAVGGVGCGRCLRGRPWAS